jgi:hypothetical protein
MEKTERTRAAGSVVEGFCLKQKRETSVQGSDLRLVVRVVCGAEAGR